MKLIPTASKVQIKWFVYAGGQKIRYESSMRGTWGYDAECSCGWETKTGGGTLASVERSVKGHKILEHDYIYIYSQAEPITDQESQKKIDHYKWMLDKLTLRPAHQSWILNQMEILGAKQ
jgi:hypothetical protein